MSTTSGTSEGKQGAGQEKAEKNRYRATLNLPQTKFDMKANLLQQEPASLKRWQAMGLYEQVRSTSKGKESFVFHDGPPYANGSIHLGHLMNKCLKDFVVRSRTMMGFDVPYVPGWDCHGLPIEHKVMLEMQEKGALAKLATMDAQQRDVIVRRECQKHAEKYVKSQAGQMQRLLTLADYANPYLTMSPQFEGATLEVLAELLAKGLVYRAVKPVHWSVANETALAEAELEYEDREDVSVYVDFEALDAEAVYDAFGLPKHADGDEDDGSEDESQEKVKGPRAGERPLQRPCFMIWTTTPWTLPANVAVAVHPEVEYSLVWIDGNVTVLASGLVEKVAKLTGSEGARVLATTTGVRLEGLRYKHPFVASAPKCALGKSCDASKVFSVVTADYVTTEDGTGLVHTAPGHGTEDYQTGMRHGLPVYCPVRGDGTYDSTVPEWLAGKDIWKANGEVVAHLRESGHLYFEQRFVHSYPHDWRSKTPVIFRCTQQWFVSVDKPGASLREGAMRAVDASNPGAVGFVPEWGRNRMRGMLESRPDWCISRQRAWGLPIPALLAPLPANAGTDVEPEVLLTSASVRAIAKVVASKGSDAWYTLSPTDLLSQYDPASDTELSPTLRAALAGDRNAFRKPRDILDVWFESGSSWNGVLRARGLGYPADLYLEGSDQHRGWFQLSLLPALGATGRAPFKTLLTHGFMVDKDGRKLSKSRPDAARYEVDSLVGEFGVDVMRWWVSSLVYENDVKIDLSFFALAGESYRKVRNTLRFMLSNLSDFVPSCDGKAGHCVDLKTLKPTSLEAWVLGEYDALEREVLRAYREYDFQAAHKALFDFCNSTLSATYFAAVKDRLYCDAKDAPRRRATQTVLWDLTDGLCRLLAPILPHTADEAYRALLRVDAGDASACVHTLSFLSGKGDRVAFGVSCDQHWPRVMDALVAARLALEARKKDGIENPLDAGVTLPDANGALSNFDPVDLADMLGVSRVMLDIQTTAPSVHDLRGEAQCQRSWKRDGTVKQRTDGGLLSDRDAAAVGVA